ncbi:MAG: DUF4153 domain-containing protein [Thiobacillus sp.]|nr:DUF4153 domain-containing protein [Thiobacillus sp.]
MTNTLTSRFPTWLGFVQGVVLYALYKTHQDKLWPLEWGWLFNAVLLCALFLPFVVYWGQNVLSRTAQQRLLLGVGLLIFGLGAYQGAMVFPLIDASRLQLASPVTFMGLALLSFMLVPLISGWARGTVDSTLGAWNYARLFEHAWRNAVITVQAGVLTGLFWAVLSLGAQLFHLIGVDWPKETIEKSWFAIPITTLSVALGLRSGLSRSAFTITLRNHWLTLTVWLLPMASLIGVAFVLTSFSGVGTLFERGLSAFFLLWFAAFWVKFFNSAYQDGQEPPALHRLLRRVLPFTALALLALVALAAWALTLRIQQYGLTPDRIWGVLVVAVALTYGIGYARIWPHAQETRWMPGIAPANIVASLIMCVGITLLLSPVLDVNRLATASQMARLQTGQVQADDFDVWALARQGRSGHDALKTLQRQRGSDGKTSKLAFRAEGALRNANRYWDDMGFGEQGKLVAEPGKRIDAYPSGTPLSADFTDFLKQDVLKWDTWQRAQGCFAQDQKHQRCAALQIDLDRDGEDEVVLWRMPNEYQPVIYARRQGRWQRIGYLMAGDDAVPDSIRAELETGSYASQPVHWNMLRVGKIRFQVFEKAE